MKLRAQISAYLFVRHQVENNFDANPVSPRIFINIASSAPLIKIIGKA